MSEIIIKVIIFHRSESETHKSHMNIEKQHEKKKINLFFVFFFCFLELIKNGPKCFISKMGERVSEYLFNRSESTGDMAFGRAKLARPFMGSINKQQRMEQQKKIKKTSSASLKKGNTGQSPSERT